MPQGSIIGPLLSNIYINDIFLFIDNGFLSNYADDSTLYTIDSDSQNALDNLGKNFLNLKSWFFENFMVLNPTKCQFMNLGNLSVEIDFVLNQDIVIPYTNQHELLGITVDSELVFDSHIKNLCKKARGKLNALSRVSTYIQEDQKRNLYNSFFKSQFSYCPLLWAFCSLHSNNLINKIHENKIHERALRLLTNDDIASFQEMLKTTNELTIHQQNINFLLVELFKFTNGFSPPIMNEVFKLRQISYNLRNIREFHTETKNKIKYRTAGNIKKLLV